MSGLRARWGVEVEEYHKSGKGQKEYARERGISASQLNYWISKLASKESKFVELKAPAKESVKMVNEDSLEIELSLPGGIVLRLRGV